MSIRIRETLRNFFEKREVPWEIFMILFSLIYVGIAFVIQLNRLPAEVIADLDTAAIAITIFFALEFITRFVIAPSKTEHLKGHWLDLVALLPFLRFFRVAGGMVHILRLARVARVFSSLDRLGIDVIEFLKLNNLQWMLVIPTTIMFASSFFLFLFEFPVNPEIRNYWDALYASLVTWTTPGYGDIAPVTTSGRVCGLILIVSGLVTWGVLVANLAAFLSTRNIRLTRNNRRNASDPAIAECQAKLNRINEMGSSELVSLRGSIDALIDSRIDARLFEEED